MIYLYSGTPGSGKSLHVAQIIVNRLRSRMPVIANFDVNRDYVKNYDGNFYVVDNDIQPEELITFSHEYFTLHRFKEESILLVLDEAQLIFNCREWDAHSRKAWVSFFTQHRKYGYRVILIAQFDRMLDRQIRSLIEYNVIHRKVSNYGTAGRIFSVLALGQLHVAVKVWYPINTKVDSEFFVARRRLYRIYDSYKQFGDAGSKDGKTP